IFLIPLCMEKKWRDRAINAFLLGMLVTVFISFLIAYTPFTWGHPPNDPASIFYNHIETSYFVAFSAFVFLHRAVYEFKLRWLNIILFGLFTFQEFFINDGRT